MEVLVRFSIILDCGPIHLGSEFCLPKTTEGRLQCRASVEPTINYFMTHPERAVFYQVRMISYFQKRQVGEQETARRFGTMCRKRWRTGCRIASYKVRTSVFLRSTRKRRVSSHEMNGGLEFICYGVQLIPQITRQ